MPSQAAQRQQPAPRTVPIPTVILLCASMLGAIALFRVFVVQPVFILSDSMAPTMYRGDRGIAFTTHVSRKLSRGDVVSFRDPRGGGDILVKRVIALPGDEFAIVGGRVSINGKIIEEPYVLEQIEFTQLPPPYTVPDKYVVVLGDNRNRSDDSLIWGPLPVSNITGHIAMIVWPPNRVKYL